MANTITHQHQTCTLTNTKSGTTVADIKYVPSLSTTWTNTTAETFSEGEFNGGTTTHTYYMPVTYDNLVVAYMS